MLTNQTKTVSFEYPKTENLFKRNDKTHKLILGDFRVPHFALIKNWHVTEKIDGTNMRVIYNPLAKTVEIRGRSDNASVHPKLIAAIEDMFPLEKLQFQFDDFIGSEGIENGVTVTIYGEGYGAGVQKGGVYRPDPSFRAFDVGYHRPAEWLDGGYRVSWCQPSTVEMICGQMDIPMVPVYPRMLTLDEIIEGINRGMVSDVAVEDSDQRTLAEGIVARTDPYLYDEKGSRIMFKLKGKDLG